MNMSELQGIGFKTFTNYLAEIQFADLSVGKFSEFFSLMVKL